MTDMPAAGPRRSAYKAAEVCEIAHIQPYVLRSWESEFPKLGVVRNGMRIYRHADLEQVLRIKHLVFDEGLTLAGARRRIEEDGQPQAELPLEEVVTPEIRQRIGQVRQALQDLLGMLGGQPTDAATGGRTVAPATQARGFASAAISDATGQRPGGKKASSPAKPKPARASRRQVGRA